MRCSVENGSGGGISKSSTTIVEGVTAIDGVGFTTPVVTVAAAAPAVVCVTVLKIDCDRRQGMEWVCVVAEIVCTVVGSGGNGCVQKCKQND